MKKYILLLTIPLIAACSDKSPITEQESTWWTEEDRDHILLELSRTTNEIRLEIKNLSDPQWYFRESPDRWSIGEIIEHLEMQNQLHYREISVLSQAPHQLEFRQITKDQDDFFINYATDSVKRKAQWFLEPQGKFCNKHKSEEAFVVVREKLYDFVLHTDSDLRKHFTYRGPVYESTIEKVSKGQVRDLHQLLLTGIAHTDRHLLQIRKIKEHPEYPA